MDLSYIVHLKQFKQKLTATKPSQIGNSLNEKNKNTVTEHKKKE
jgi:hypothetical protein